MTPEALSDLHALAFGCGPPRPWTADEFRTLLDAPHNQLLTNPGGFALFQLAGEEAELLTLAIHPAQRRQGHARALLMAADGLTGHGVRDIILEVANTNTAARALYAATGFADVGVRKNYYKSPRGARVDALVLRKTLS